MTSMKHGKAIVTPGDGTFSVKEIDVAPPAENEVRVMIKASGICHTDYDSLKWGPELILGHEGAGIVESIGEGVNHVKVGDHVVLNWAIPCGSCYQCEHENEALCEKNSPVTSKNPENGHAHAGGTTIAGQNTSRSFNLGTLSTVALVRKEAVVKTDKTIPFASACIVGCGVMTGYGSVVNAAKVQAGSSVVVIGCGGVGLNVIQAAKIAGATKIFAIDLSQARLEMAKAFGATAVIQPAENDRSLIETAKLIHQQTENRGADYAFECTAVPALGAAPLRMIRHGGMALQLSGIEQEISFDMELFEWDKVYLNPLYGKCRPAVDFPAIFNHYKAGQFKLDELVSRTYSIDQLAAVFDDMHAGRIAKGVILF